MRFFLLKKKKFQSSAALKLIFCWVDFRMNGVLLGFSRAVGGSTMQFIALSHTSCSSGGLWTISSSRRIKLSRACLLSDVLLNYIPPKCPRKKKKKKTSNYTSGFYYLRRKLKHVWIVGYCTLLFPLHGETNARLLHLFKTLNSVDDSNVVGPL